MTDQNAASGLSLTDVLDCNLLAARDPNHIFASMAVDSKQPGIVTWLNRCNPEDYDYLVVAEERTDGRAVGLLCANEHATSAEEFLFVSAVFVTPAARKRRIMRRMLATALLQAARRGPVPRVIAVRSCNPMTLSALRRFAQYVPGAILYPTIEETTVNLATATLARRIARAVSPTCHFDPATGVLHGAVVAHGLLGCTTPQPAYHADIDDFFARRVGPMDQLLALVDLRHVDEATILDKARQLHRRR